MTDRPLENVYFANGIQVDSNGVDIVLDPIWISNLNSNKKIRIREIAADIDSDAGYTFRLKVNYYVLQDEMMDVYTVHINFNLTTQKMSDIGQIIVDRMKRVFRCSARFLL
jgi:hypothetical protein